MYFSLIKNQWILLIALKFWEDIMSLFPKIYEITEATEQLYCEKIKVYWARLLIVVIYFIGYLSFTILLTLEVYYYKYPTY